MENITQASPKNNRKQSQIANRLRVLRLIYSSTPYSQRGIVLETQLQASTISNIVSEFLDMGLIVEGESLERDGVGPRETILHINPDKGITVGVNIHAASQGICLIKSDSTIIAEKRFQYPWDSKALSKIASHIQDLVKAEGYKMHSVKGVGLAIPGVVDNESGVTILSRALQVENYPIRAEMAKRLQVPVIIDRNVNYGSYLEHYANPSLNSENAGYLLVSKVMTRRKIEEYSVGMSLTLNGKVYRGTNHAAGELDAALLPSEDLAKSECTKTFFESFGKHFASVINLLDIGHLLIVSEHKTLSPEDFSRFSKALQGSLIPISRRRFELSRSQTGIDGIARGAALHALHQFLEADLGEYILSRGK